MFCTSCGKEIPNTSNFCKYCGNEVRKFENEIQTQKTVKVIFHRTKRFLGCAVPLNVYIDNKLIGSLNNNGTFEIDIPCGTHEVILEMWSCVNKQQVTFSEEYSKVYLDIKIKMGLLTNKPEIISIRNECDKVCQESVTSTENGMVQENLNYIPNNATINPQYNQTNNNAGKTNTSATVGFVCSLVGIFLAGIVMGTLAISLGVSGKKHIEMFKNEKGKGLATAAIVIGAIDVVGAIFAIIMNTIL